MAKLPTDYKTARQKFLEAPPEMQTQILEKYPILGVEENELIEKISAADESTRSAIFNDYPEFEDPGYFKPSAGLGSVLFNAPAGALAQTIESVGGLTRAAEDLLGTGTEYGKNMANEGRLAARQLSEEMNLQPDRSWGDFFKTMIYGGVTSAAQQAPLIVAAAANPTLAPAALGTMGAMSAGSRYNQTREENYLPVQAAVQGALYGGAEVAGEYLPLHTLLEKSGLDVGALASKVVKYVATEVGSELGTEAAQHATDKVAQMITENPDANVEEFWPRMRDTALQTLIAAPLLGGAGVITQGVMGRATNRQVPSVVDVPETQIENPSEMTEIQMRELANSVVTNAAAEQNFSQAPMDSLQQIQQAATEMGQTTSSQQSMAAEAIKTILQMTATNASSGEQKAVEPPPSVTSRPTEPTPVKTPEIQSTPPSSVLHERAIPAGTNYIPNQESRSISPETTNTLPPNMQIKGIAQETKPPAQAVKLWGDMTFDEKADAYVKAKSLFPEQTPPLSVFDKNMAGTEWDMKTLLPVLHPAPQPSLENFEQSAQPIGLTPSAKSGIVDDGGVRNGEVDATGQNISSAVTGGKEEILGTRSPAAGGILQEKSGNAAENSPVSTSVLSGSSGSGETAYVPGRSGTSETARRGNAQSGRFAEIAQPSQNNLIENVSEDKTEHPNYNEPQVKPPSPGIKGAADSITRLWKLNTTELIRLYDHLGAKINVKQNIKARGDFSPTTGNVRINAELGKDSINKIAQTIAHELGHFVDWDTGAVNKSMARGNVLGHIAALANYFKRTLNLKPEGQPSNLDKTTREKLYRQAKRTVENSAIWFESNFDQKLISEEYGRLLSEYIDDNELITQEKAQQELINHTKKWRGLDDVSFRSDQKYYESPAELYADAFSALLVDPRELAVNAPTVSKMLYDYMVKGKPEFYAVYRSFQEKIENMEDKRANIDWLNQRMKEATDKKIQELLRRPPDQRILLSLKDSFIDNLSALYDLAKSGAKLDTEFINKIEAFRDYKDIVEGFLESFFPSVIEELHKNNLDVGSLKIESFLKRIIGERSGKVLDVVDAKYAKELSDELGAQYTADQVKAINNAFVKMWENRQPLLKEIEDLGVFSDELMNYILNTKDYFTWDVAKKIDGTIGKKSPATAAIIKKQIGTFSAVVNPYFATILKDISLIRFAKKQALVKASLAKLNELRMPVREARTEFRGGFQQFVEPDHKSGLALVTHMEKGEVKGYYVEKRIAEALENRTMETGGGLRLLSMLNRPIRASLTGANPAFVLFANPIRDVAKSFIAMPYSLRNFGEWSKHFVREFYKALTGTQDRESIISMKREGLLIGDRETLVSPELVKDEETYLKTLYERQGDLSDFEKSINKFTAFFTLLNKIQVVGKRFERAPKVAAYKFYQGIKEEYGLTENDIAYFVRNFAGSPDFRRTGASYALYNNVVLYSNAIKEAYRAIGEAATYSPREFLVKAAALSLTPVLLTLAGETKDPEWWNKVSEYDKTNYMIVPLGYDENQKPVYVRLPMDESVRLFASILRKTFKVKTDNIPQTIGNIVAIGADEMPSTGPAIQALGIIGQYLAGQNPYDFFRGREILTDRQYKQRHTKPLEAQYEVFKHIWNNVGGGTWFKFSPEYDKLEKTDIEKLTKMPVLGFNIFGKFVKVGYDRDIESDNQKRQKLDVQNAAELDLIDSSIKKTLAGNDNEITAEERRARIKHPNYFRQNLLERRNPEAARKKQNQKRELKYKKTFGSE